MKIPRGVSYHKVDDKIFVHNVDTLQDYLLDGSAGEILDYVAAHPNSSVPELLKFFASKYDDAYETIGDFVDEMLAEKIFIEAEDFEETPSAEIIEEVETRFLKSNRLFSLMAELTYRCAEKCVHCYIDDTASFCAKNELTTDDWKNIFRQARKTGCVKVLFTGGEVLLRPDLCDLVDYAVELGFIVDVYTTGLGMTDEIFDRLCAAKVNSVSFSLYGGDAASHDAITGVRGSFDKTLMAMLMFKSAGVGTFIKSVAIKQNFNALEGLYKLGKRLKIHVSISTQIGSGREWKRAEDYRLGKAQLYEKFFALDAKFSQRKISAKSPQELDKIRDKLVCAAGLNSMRIDPFGETYPCTHFQNSFGNARIKGISELWSNINAVSRKKIPIVRELTPKCSACRHVEFCHMCLAEFERTDMSDCGNVLVEARAATKSYGQLT